MARNNLDLSIPRFCPKCKSKLIKSTRKSRDRTRWDCPNEICDIIAVNYTAFSKGHDFDINKIFYETRPRLHYTTTILYYDNILQQGGGEE